jgi:hypothetical protein
MQHAAGFVSLQFAIVFSDEVKFSLILECKALGTRRKSGDTVVPVLGGLWLAAVVANCCGWFRVLGLVE